MLEISENYKPNKAYAKQLDKEMAKAEELPNFINETEIFETLEKAKNPDKVLIKDILDKASAIDFKGLSLFETACLLNNQNPELDEAIFEVAKEIKLRIYGKRMVLFAPLYVTNKCKNSCAYCGFSAKNKELHRKTLTLSEISKEAQVIEEMGHKRVLMVYGEYDYDADWLASTIKAVYETKTGTSGQIRRVNINCAPLDEEGFLKLKSAGIGTYQCFHETYHQETYQKMHLGGRKKSYLWRLYSLHRAQNAGLDDVATGALFGLYDYKFEILGLLMHANQLEKDFGVGPHTISFPRLEPAQGSEISFKPPWTISDYEFKKIVAILRLAVPYTGLILSTRENAELRREVLKLGVSQLSAGSRTYPGGYSEIDHSRVNEQQFCTGDDRSLDEVIYDLTTSLEYMPSFCTGCYRKGRTGDHFMGLAKTSFINKFCTPNAMITFLEYLNDYASEKTKEAGYKLIDKELMQIDDAAKREKVKDMLFRTNKGERDLYY